MSAPIARRRATTRRRSASTGPGLWWDSSTLTAADGTTLAAFPDSSGSGHDGAQTTTANQPIVRAAARNGLRAVEFTGATAMASGWVPQTGAGPRTVMLAMAPTSFSGNRYDQILQWGSQASSQGYGPVTRQNFTSRYGNHYWSTFFDSGPAGAVNTWIVLTSVYDSSVDTYYNQGTQIAANTITLNTGSAFPLVVGNQIGGAVGARMLLGELRVWSRALTASEVATTASSVAAKWAIA